MAHANKIIFLESPREEWHINYMPKRISKKKIRKDQPAHMFFKSLERVVEAKDEKTDAKKTSKA
jgi:hypothetical protein